MGKNGNKDLYVIKVDGKTNWNFTFWNTLITNNLCKLKAFVHLPWTLAQFPTCYLHSPVWGEDDGAALFDDTQDTVPQEPTRFGVHACRGLVLGENRGLLYLHSSVFLYLLF